MLAIKAEVAKRYAELFESLGIVFVGARKGASANYWLNAIVLNSLQERNAFLEFTNNQGMMTRPIWPLMSRLTMFQHCQHDDLANSIWMKDQVVNILFSSPDGVFSAFNRETL